MRFELFAASLLIMSRAMLVLKIRAGRRELRDNQKEVCTDKSLMDMSSCTLIGTLEQKLVKGISAERADEDLREMCVAYTILLRKALLVETDVRIRAIAMLHDISYVISMCCT
eukprot:2912578-Amphidinium_carterae.1